MDFDGGTFDGGVYGTALGQRRADRRDPVGSLCDGNLALNEG